MTIIRVRVGMMLCYVDFYSFVFVSFFFWGGDSDDSYEREILRYIDTRSVLMF